MKRQVYRIQQLRARRWHVTGGIIASVHRLQSDAIAMGVRVCRRKGTMGEHCQLVLHGANGRIRWERTYPRKSDPRTRKG